MLLTYKEVDLQSSLEFMKCSKSYMNLKTSEGLSEGRKRYKRRMKHLIRTFSWNILWKHFALKGTYLQTCNLAFSKAG